MTKFLASVTGVLFLSAALLADSYAQPAGANRGATLLPAQCDRACLNGLVDQYLQALLAHDPKRLPLSPKVKFTENGQGMEVGDGMWGTLKR